MKTILNVKKLRLNFQADRQKHPCLSGVNLWINQGEIVGLLGESGCGKSMTAHAIMRLLPSTAADLSGEIWLNDEDVLKKSEKEMRAIRGRQMGMIFQNPMTSLNPTRTIGSQIIEGISTHTNIPSKEARRQALELLNDVGIPDPEERYNQYPYQFSGGMRQRVMIAMAIGCNPALLIADEPTTALDVTIQAQILVLLKNLQKQKGMSILLISHDLGVIAGMCDRVFVMQKGEIIESASVDELFYSPQHPYTCSLLKAHPYFVKRELLTNVK